MAQFDPDMYTTPFQLTKTVHREPYDELLPSKPSNSQKGKIVIITGGYGGIGAAMALVWARAGASVVIVGRKADKLAGAVEATKSVATDPAAKIIGVTADITVESEVQNLYKEIRATFGRVADVLINNAGSNGIFSLMAQIPWDDFTNVFSSHFFGAALMTKYFIDSQATPTDPVGTIIYITSGIGGMIMPTTSSYSIAKMAGQRLTEYLDAEYPHLRTFTLSPGIVLTSLTQESFKPFAKDHVELPGMMTVYLSQTRADFLRGGFVGVNWDVKEMEANKDEIVNQKLLKMQWVAAKFGSGGHPFGS